MRGMFLLVTMSLCPGTFSEASDFDMAVKALPMEDCQVLSSEKGPKTYPTVKVSQGGAGGWASGQCVHGHY